MTYVHKGLTRIFQALLLTVVWALVPATSQAAQNFTPKQTLALIQEAAKKKDFSKEFTQIIKASDEVEKVLIEVLHSSANRWEERWFSAITLGKRGSEAARKALLKASKDDLFIARQAATQGLSYFSDGETLQAIRARLNDTAMVVRSEAIDAIAKRKDVGSISLLEKELYASRNYQKGRSLWIRPQIVHVFGELGHEEVLGTLMKALKDKDPKVVAQSCKSLETVSIKNQWEYPKKSTKCSETWARWYQNRNNTQKENSNKKK